MNPWVGYRAVCVNSVPRGLQFEGIPDPETQDPATAKHRCKPVTRHVGTLHVSRVITRLEEARRSKPVAAAGARQGGDQIR